MNTTESNKLIAEFMGMKHLNTQIDSHNYEQYTYSMPEELSKQVYGYAGATCFLEDQFSKSWDWLMPVVQAICNTALPVKITDKTHYEGLLRAKIYDSIQVIFNHVVNWIEWYNREVKPKILKQRIK